MVARPVLPNAAGAGADCHSPGVLGAAESWGIGEEDLAQVKSMEEAEMVYHAIEELKEQYRREGLGRGRAEGRADSLHATMACRLTRLKFGAETAERLSQLLEGIADPERIARHRRPHHRMRDGCGTAGTRAGRLMCQPRWLDVG